MNFIHKLEPLWWMLFGGGGFVAGFFLPGLLIGVCLLAPLGVFESGLRYERAYALASSGAGRIFLGLVISLTLWHCSHHLRHLGLDLGLGVTAPAITSYTLALLGTIITVALVVTL